MAYGSTAGATSMGNAPMPVRETQVNREVLGMQEHAEQLHLLIGALEDRLSGVLRSNPPAPASIAKDASSEPSVPLARAAWELNKRFDQARHRIQDIIDRIEV